MLKALVVHTKSLKADLDAMGLSNIVQIDYPEFMDIKSIPRNDALAELEITVNDGDKVLLSLGGTRSDKGLDILLEALKTVKGNFRDFILNKISSYESRVSLMLEYLDEKNLRSA